MMSLYSCKNEKVQKTLHLFAKGFLSQDVCLFTSNK